jgi:hypothetical protein
MVELSEIQAAYYMVAATGVLVAAIYYIYNMNATRRTQELALKSQEQTLVTRQAQLFMGVNQTSFSKEYQIARNRIKDTVTDYDSFLEIHKDKEWNADFYNVAGYYEGIGVLVRENLVDIRLVSLLSSGELVGFWQTWGAFMLRARRDWGFPRYAIEIEYLAKRISDYGLEHPELGIVSLKPLKTMENP